MKKLLFIISFIVVLINGTDLYADNSFWKLDVFLQKSQIFTGTYADTNCVPTTVYHLLKFTGKEYNGTIEDIRRVMLPYSDNVGRGITYDEMMRFIKKEDLGLEYGQKYFGASEKEQCKEYILKTLETGVMVNQLDLQYNKKDYSFNRFAGHCVIIAGSFTLDDNFYLHILDPADGLYHSWDFDTWWKCYMAWNNGGPNILTSFNVTNDRDVVLATFVHPDTPFEQWSYTVKPMIVNR